MLAFSQCYGCIYEGALCPADSSETLKKAIVRNEPCCAKVTIPALHYFLTNTPKKEILALRRAAFENVERHER